MQEGTQSCWGVPGSPSLSLKGCAGALSSPPSPQADGHSLFRCSLIEERWLQLVLRQERKMQGLA